MNIFKNLKFSWIKLFTLVMACSVLLGIGIGRTIAFFTDKKESTGIFTLGNVYIEMTEAAVKYDSSGNLVEDTSLARIQGSDSTVEGGTPTVHNYGMVTPGQTIHKDPTVRNTGDVNAWVAVKVILEDGIGDIHSLYKYSSDFDQIDIERLLQGGLLDETVHVGTWMGIDGVCYNENYAMLQVASRASGKYEFYFIMLDQLAPQNSVEVFETLFFQNYFGNAEMNQFKEFKITVQAFAVQTNGFDSCYAAMTTAFPDYFSGIKTASNGQ